MTNLSHNHHYVSQCLMRNFESEKGYYIYDKVEKRFFKTNGSKKLFSETDLNITLVDDEESDSVEKILASLFEEDFSNHYNRVKQFCNCRSGDIKDSIYYLGRMGLIGEQRNSRIKKAMDDSIFGVFHALADNASQELKESFNDLNEKYSRLKYKISIDYKEFADNIFSNMGEWSFDLYCTRDNGYLFLPDVTAVINRHRINDYFNPDALDIAEIGIPLDNHIFLHVFSNKIGRSHNENIHISDDQLIKINRLLYDSAKCKLICGDKSFLEQTIKIISCP